MGGGGIFLGLYDGPGGFRVFFIGSSRRSAGVLWDILHSFYGGHLRVCGEFYRVFMVVSMGFVGYFTG